MAASLLGQVKELEEKIKAALGVARSLQSEKEHLARDVSRVRQELEQARAEAAAAKSEASAARAELASVTAKIDVLLREKQDLERERGEVLERVEHLISSLAELEAAAAAT